MIGPQPLRRLVATRRRLLEGALGAGASALNPFGSSRTARRPPDDRPNVILISVDDLSWRGFGCYGNEFHETPAIDRLAEQGMRFTQAYSGGPVCSPSRASLMTGLYPARTGITNFLHDEPAPSDLWLTSGFRTVPERIADEGYRSLLIGKWHLTEDYSGPYRERKGNPYSQGFDDVLLSEERYIGGGDYWYPYRFLPGVRSGLPREYLTDRITRDLTAWVHRNRSTPFFVHVSNYAIHYRWSAKAALIRKYEEKRAQHPEFQNAGCRPVVAAMVERLDKQVRDLVRVLEQDGIAENTLILITSDNGGAIPEANRPLKQGKGSLHEGGIRVPLIAYWPGTVPEGSVCDDPVSHIDVLPTVSRLARAGGATGVDGVSLVGVLTRGGTVERPLYWYYPHALGGSPPSAAVRDGRYKLIKRLRTGAVELYDLETDVRERHNVAGAHPEVTARLRTLLHQHLDEVRRVPAPPDAFGEVELEVDLADPRRSPGHDTLPIGPAGPAGAGEDRGPVATTSSGRRLLRSRRSPHTAEVALVLTPRQDDAAATSQVVGVGLILDAYNHLTIDYDDARHTVGWELVTEGVPRRYRPEEPLDHLEGTVDLSAAEARLGLTMRDGTVAAYADQGHGAGWEFLFLLDVGGVLDLADAEQRRHWRYGVLADGDDRPSGSYQVRRPAR